MDNTFFHSRFDPDEDYPMTGEILQPGTLFDDETINRLYQSYKGIKDINDLDALEKRMGISTEDKRKIIEDILAEINNKELSNKERLALQKKYFGEKKHD